VRFQPVAMAERQRLAQRGQEVQQSRDQRRTLEAVTVATLTTRKPEATLAPAKVTLPRSPIVAKPVSQLRKNQAPPKAPQSPKPAPARREAAAPSAMQVPPPSQPRPLDAVVKSPAVPPRSAPGVERKAQPQLQQRANGPAVKTRDDGQQSAGAMEKDMQRASGQSFQSRPIAGEKGATRLMQRDLGTPVRGQSSPAKTPSAPRPASL
jgi:hypothetical protein